MTPISAKLAQECQDGTMVLAYRFPIPLNITDENETSDDTNSSKPSRLLSADLVYEEEEMRIYRCKTESSDT